LLTDAMISPVDSMLYCRNATQCPENPRRRAPD
jgi:hypothetical protein